MDSTLSSGLLEKVRIQDAEAWKRLVHVYGPLVYHWCRRSGLSDEDAADVGQDVFRSVAQGIVRFRRDSPEDTFGGWLRVIANRKILDHVRQLERCGRGVGGSDFQYAVSQIPSPGSDIEVTEDRISDSDADHFILGRTLESIRANFSESAWRAFWDTAVEGRAAADVARELNMTDMAVRKAKSRVLRQLREVLDGEGFC